MMGLKSGQTIIEDRFPSVFGSEKKIVDIIIKRIKEYPASRKIDYDELYLVIDEALANAMEHGNHWDPHKHVDVRITRTNEYISISIEDEGLGFNIDQYNGNSLPNLNPRGRGIQIIKHFCKPEWESPGNKINFCINIK